MADPSVGRVVSPSAGGGRHPPPVCVRLGPVVSAWARPASGTRGLRDAWAGLCQRTRPRKHTRRLIPGGRCWAARLEGSSSFRWAHGGRRKLACPPPCPGSGDRVAAGGGRTGVSGSACCGWHPPGSPSSPAAPRGPGGCRLQAGALGALTPLSSLLRNPFTSVQLKPTVTNDRSAPVLS